MVLSVVMVIAMTLILSTVKNELSATTFVIFTAKLNGG